MLTKWIDILVPLAMAVFGFIGATRSEFYPGRLGGSPRAKPIPKWFGPVWFFTFGAGCLYLSIRNFLHR